MVGLCMHGHISSMQMKTQHRCKQDKVLYCQQHSLCRLSYNTHCIATVRPDIHTGKPLSRRALSVAIRLAKRVSRYSPNLCRALSVAKRVSRCSPLSKERRSLSPSPISSRCARGQQTVSSTSSSIRSGSSAS